MLCLKTLVLGFYIDVAWKTATRTVCRTMCNPSRQLYIPSATELFERDKMNCNNWPRILWWKWHWVQNVNMASKFHRKSDPVSVKYVGKNENGDHFLQFTRLHMCGANVWIPDTPRHLYRSWGVHATLVSATEGVCIVLKDFSQITDVTKSDNIDRYALIPQSNFFEKWWLNVYFVFHHPCNMI